MNLTQAVHTSTGEICDRPETDEHDTCQHGVRIHWEWL